MTRREVLGAAAAWTAAGGLPLLGATVPVGLSPVQGFLSEQTPGSGPVPALSMKHAILRWTNTAPESGETTNREIGRLELRLERSGEHTRVKVLQTTRYSQPNNRLEAEIVCNRDPLLSLRSWKLKSSIEERDDCLYEVSGRREGDSVHMDDGIGERSFGVEGPLVCQWTLAMSTAVSERLPGRFGLLEDLLLYKPGQRLTREPAVDVPYQDGEHRMTCYSQRGPGVLPLHYYADEQGRTQLVTQGALAWALVEAG